MKHVEHQKICLLTMDLENDCGGRIGPVFDTINTTNLTTFVNFMKKQNVPLTLFTTGKIFEEKGPNMIAVNDTEKTITFYRSGTIIITKPGQGIDSDAYPDDASILDSIIEMVKAYGIDRISVN